MRTARWTCALVATLAGNALVGCAESNVTVTIDGGAGLVDAGRSGLSDAGHMSVADASVFIDAGAAIDSCDPVNQTQCAPPFTKCVVEGTEGGTMCISPSPDDLPLGASCQGQDCEAGLACARLTNTSTVTACVKVCDLTSGTGCESLGPDFECRTRLTGTGWGACSELAPQCDPYTQAPCDRSEACQPFLRRTGSWEFRCRTAGMAQEGEPCGASNAAVCGRGLACVSTPQGSAFCRQICRVSTDCRDLAQCAGVVSQPSFMYCVE